jgi:parallel beta-helix repeat protein
VTATQVFSNTIANNGFDGIAVSSTSTNNPIGYNQIHDNGALGIDLSDDGQSPNDGTGDPDTGGNNLLNYPVLTSADSASGEIVGSLVSAPNTPYQIAFYRSDTCDPSGYGEGAIYLGSYYLNTDASGSATFTATIGGFSAGHEITALATDVYGNTSEFSACVEVDPGAPTVTPTVTQTPGPSPTATPPGTPEPSPTATTPGTPGPSPTATVPGTPGPSPTASATVIPGPPETGVYLPLIQK